MSSVTEGQSLSTQADYDKILQGMKKSKATVRRQMRRNSRLNLDEPKMVELLCCWIELDDFRRGLRLRALGS